MTDLLYLFPTNQQPGQTAAFGNSALNGVPK